MRSQKGLRDVVQVRTPDQMTAGRCYCMYQGRHVEASFKKKTLSAQVQLIHTSNTMYIPLSYRSDQSFLYRFAKTSLSFTILTPRAAAFLFILMASSVRGERRRESSESAPENAFSSR